VLKIFKLTSILQVAKTGVNKHFSNGLTAQVLLLKKNFFAEKYAHVIDFKTGSKT